MKNARNILVMLMAVLMLTVFTACDNKTPEPGNGTEAQDATLTFSRVLIVGTDKMFAVSNATGADADISSYTVNLALNQSSAEPVTVTFPEGTVLKKDASIIFYDEAICGHLTFSDIAMLEEGKSNGTCTYAVDLYNLNGKDDKITLDKAGAEQEELLVAEKSPKKCAATKLYATGAEAITAALVEDVPYDSKSALFTDEVYAKYSITDFWKPSV